jgi:sorbitol/mannitol transport system permease protein
MARAASTSRKVTVTAAAWIVGLIIFFPILWTILTSFKTEGDAIAFPPSFFPPHWTLENYFEVQARSDYFRHFMNSVIISIGSTLLALLVAVPAAWAMAFAPTPKTKDIMMWMLYTYFKEIPVDILEAARMDGATLGKELVYVLVPMAVPGIASTMLLNIILAWNEAFWTLNLTAARAAPLTAFIASYSSPEGLFWAKLSAASTLAILPILILGWISQKQLVRGLTFGAVK